MHSRRSSCLCVTATIIVTAAPCFAQTSDNKEKALLDAENPIATFVTRMQQWDYRLGINGVKRMPFSLHG